MKESISYDFIVLWSKTWRLAHLYFIEIPLVNDISISIEYKHYEKWLLLLREFIRNLTNDLSLGFFAPVALMVVRRGSVNMMVWFAKLQKTSPIISFPNTSLLRRYFQHIFYTNWLSWSKLQKLIICQYFISINNNIQIYIMYNMRV